MTLVPDLRGRIWHARQIEWTGCPYFGRTTPQKLFKDCNGTSVISSCKHFWKEASGHCGQSGLACFSRVLDEFEVLCVVLIQFKGEIFNRHAVVFLATSKTKISGMKPQNCLDKDLRTSLSQLFFSSESSFSSVVVRLLALFGRLPLPCCRSRLAFPSRTCFELLNSLSRIIECLYSFSVRYRSIAVTITRRLSGS